MNYEQMKQKVNELQKNIVGMDRFAPEKDEEYWFYKTLAKIWGVEEEENGK